MGWRIRIEIEVVGNCQSDSSLFDVVDVEPDINNFIFGDKLWDISFEEFLEDTREIDGSGIAEFIIPEDNIGFSEPEGFIRDPLFHCIVVGTGGYKILKLRWGDAGKVKELVIEWAVKFIVTQRSIDFSAAFIESSPGYDKTSQ